MISERGVRLLVDTNILIDIRKSKGDKEAQKRYAQILYAHDIYVPGVVEAELLHGAVSEKNQRELHKSLDIYTEMNLRDGDWRTLGDQLYTYRTHGITVPLADAIISAISIIRDIPVWTDDKHFGMMQSVIPKLSIIRTEDLL